MDQQNSSSNPTAQSSNSKEDEQQLSQAERQDDLTIEKKMRVEDFYLLCEKFNQNDDQLSESERKSRGVLNKEEFISSFQPILDTVQYGNQLEKLFDKLNSKETGLINWNDFCTYMLQFYQEEDFANSLRTSPFNSEPKIRHVPHNKQETTTKILHLENPIRFINVSKEGYLGLWTSSLNLEKSYSATEDVDDGLNGNATGIGQNRRKAGMWISDAIYMPDVHKLVLTSTSRDLRFFTVSNETFLEDFILFGLKNVPTCLEYYPSNRTENGESILIFGDDEGVIHILYFKKPLNSLFDPLRRKGDPNKSEKANPSATQRIYWEELKEHGKFVRHLNMGPIHREYVRKILYVPHNSSIIASSGDSRQSLIVTHINRLKKPYIFRLYKGCECFDFSKTLNMLVTGSADYLARVWNPYVTQKNVAILEGHHAAVIDVKINDRIGQCYTYSKDAVVKAWDLKEFTCLQTITIRFPTTLGGKTPTFGLFPMDLYLNDKKQNPNSNFPGALVLGCNDYLCLMKLGQDAPIDPNFPETHRAPLSCAVYNSKLRQLITCSDNSSMAAWDIESGRKAFFIVDAHDGEEITCISIDRACRKLATGARNGIIKIWNSANGLNLHVLPRVEDAEITGIVFFDKGIITVGWSRKIIKYTDIVSELVTPKADVSWRGSQIHRDDILCLETLFPIVNLMCSASYDGEIHVWNMDTEKLLMSLRKAPKFDSRRPPSNYRRSSSRRAVKRTLTPVDKLLFLRSRAKENMKYGVLMSSEGGYLHCWSLYGERKEMGMFHAASQTGETILVMCSDTRNQYLITGDTKGEIRVWDIRNYCCSIVSPVAFTENPPSLVHSWQAHLSPLIFCEWTNYKSSGNFILTASTDHTARLWTIDGEQIGIFGQSQLWDIESTLLGHRVKINQQSNIEIVIDQVADNNDAISNTHRTDNHSHLPNVFDKNNEQDHRPLSSSIQYSDISDSTETTLIELRREAMKTPKITGLGEMVDNDLKQKKLARQERRSRFSDIDGHHLAKGGVCFTPFALLSTQDVDDALIHYQRHSRSKSKVLEGSISDEIANLPNPKISTGKHRLVLPPIMSRQTTSSSITTQSSSTVDIELDPFYLSKKQSSMATISEI